ncbi:TPA: insulinase family protein [Streptococcus suis]
MTFTLLESRDLADIQSVGHLYQHDETGAQVLYFENQDSNKAFTISFNTPPYNDNGIAHILEHSVLNGSKKYPSKEPFVELIKGSLNTFVNAMTYPDKTVYPVASTNQQDFSNLMAVYLDAVFAPNLYHDPQILQQEGWHYHLEKPEDDLIYKGVVYNEMKGAMASAEGNLYFETVKTLYPGTFYAIESGGMPSAIPSLTQEEFVAFHQKYYHPSQSLTVLYGDLDLDQALSQLAEYFDGAGQVAEKVDLAIDVPYVSRAQVEKAYSITEGEDPTNKDFLALAWHAHVAEDLVESVALDVVMDVLFGNNQAPIKKALLDAKIAGDFSAHHDNFGYFAMNIITAKFTDGSKMDQFVQIITEKLGQIAEEGVDPDLITAALNQYAFRYKENSISESNPRGVIYALGALHTWQYGLNPLDAFNVTETLETLRQRFKTDYFQELVKTYFTQNDHWAKVTLKADPGLNDRQEKALHQELQAYKASLSDEQIKHLVESTNALIERQNTPDKPEDLAKIPSLTKADLNTDTEDLPLEVTSFGDYQGQYYFAPQFTAGIDYLEWLFSIDDVPLEDLQWLNLLSNLLGKLPTANYSSKDLMTACDLYTGGIGSSVRVIEKEQGMSLFFALKGKALEENADHLINLMAEIGLHTNLDQVEEITNVVQSLVAKFDQRLDYSAHAVAITRAISQLNPIGKISEVITGIDQYFFLKSVQADLEAGKGGEVVSRLQAVYRLLANKTRLSIFYIGDQANQASLGQATLQAFQTIQALPLGPTQNHQAGSRQKEAFVTSQDVNYVAQASHIDDFDFNGQYNVLANALRYDYLWNNIRVKGGAYGAMYGLRRNGDLFLASYRDPNIVKTLETYGGVGDYIHHLEASDEAILKYMIGTLSELNQPKSAADKGNTAFVLYQQGRTTQNIIQFKEEILATDLAQLKALEATIRKAVEDATVVVIGNKAQIDAVKDQFDQVIELY